MQEQVCTAAGRTATRLEAPRASGRFQLACASCMLSMRPQYSNVVNVTLVDTLVTTVPRAAGNIYSVFVNVSSLFVSKDQACGNKNEPCNAVNVWSRPTGWPLGQPCSTLSKGDCRWNENFEGGIGRERSYEACLWRWMNVMCTVSCLLTKCVSQGPPFSVCDIWEAAALWGKKMAWPQSEWIQSVTVGQTCWMLSCCVSSHNRQLHNFDTLLSKYFFSGMR